MYHTGSSSEMAVAAAFAAATHWGGGATGSLFSTSAASIYSPQSGFSPSSPADAFTDGAVSSLALLPGYGKTSLFLSVYIVQRLS